MGFTECHTSIDDCILSRRCLMTGEYCSKQTNIQKERKNLHKEGKINAFVIMNYSSMSDVVYKWRLKSFIQSLAKYLYINKQKNRLYCFNTCYKDGKTPRISDETRLEQIKEIKVVRADSNLSSNFVICTRVCQQMQIADLVIADVSVENTNVFYELGMAVALGKMILPICYSESFYAMHIPTQTTERIKKKVSVK